MRWWLIKLRKERNLSQDDVAAAAQVTRQQISVIETGKGDPSVPVAKKIGELLGFNWTRFFN